MLSSHVLVFIRPFIFVFVEREENVKADIFHAYVTLLKQTKPQAAANDPNAMDESEGYIPLQLFPQLVQN